MTSEKTALFQQGAHGINVWKIWNVDNIIYITANGQEYSEIVNEGKASRTIEEQVQLRINARINNKLDSGFVRSMDELSQHKLNQLGLPLPMLAKPYKDVQTKVKIDNCYLQPKLDGHRCIITKLNNQIVAYSRRGKWIKVIDHIVDELNYLSEGYFLDGELYKHGTPLQTIASLVRRDTALPDTETIQYHIYDVFHINKLRTQYCDRYDWLRKNIKTSNIIQLVETINMENSRTKLPEQFTLARNSGYEGVILRPKYGVYGIGKRPDSLIKVKERLDAEFKCVDIIPTRDGWGNLILETNDGTQFKCTAPGTIADKIATLNNKHKFIGKMITCEFAHWTNDHKPFHCVAIRWKDDI